MSNSDITIPTTGISLNDLFTNSIYAAFTGSYVKSPANQANFSKMRAAKYDSSNTNPFSIGTELKGKKVGLINSVAALGSNFESLYFNISKNPLSSDINDYVKLFFNDSISPQTKEYPIFYEEGDVMTFVMTKQSPTGFITINVNPSYYNATQQKGGIFEPDTDYVRVNFLLDQYASSIFTEEPLNLEFTFHA